METFCTNPLHVRDFTVIFNLDFRKNQKRYFETEVISSLNVTSETDEDTMTHLLNNTQPCWEKQDTQLNKLVK